MLPNIQCVECRTLLGTSKFSFDTMFLIVETLMKEKKQKCIIVETSISEIRLKMSNNRNMFVSIIRNFFNMNG